MMKNVLFTFSTLALASAFAASNNYKVTLFDQSNLAGTSLKPGDYKIELNDNSVTMKNGKNVAEAAATTETSDTKYRATTIRYNDQHQIQEICLGGTNKKIVLGNGAAASNTNSTGSTPGAPAAAR